MPGPTPSSSLIKRSRNPSRLRSPPLPDLGTPITLTATDTVIMTTITTTVTTMRTPSRLGNARRRPGLVPGLGTVASVSVIGMAGLLISAGTMECTG